MVLAAGLGTRLRPLTNLMPKPMAPVVNRPVMEHIVALLAKHGFEEAISNVSHLPEQITEHFGDGSNFGVSLSYSVETELLGTAGGVRNAADFLGDDFLVISGDALTDIDLAALRAAHEANDGVATLACRRVADTSEYGVVISGEDGRVQGFQEKPDPAEALSDLCNCGIYAFSSEIFDHFPAPGTSAAAKPDSAAGFADWAMDVFPALLASDIPFYVHEFDDYWNDIGSFTELLEGNADALSGAVAVNRPGEQLADGVYGPQGFDLSGIDATGPVLIGDDATIGAGTRLHGPVVVGPGSRVGAGSSLRESVLLGGSVLPDGTVLIGAIAGAAAQS